MFGPRTASSPPWTTSVAGCLCLAIGAALSACGDGANARFEKMVMDRLPGVATVLSQESCDCLLRHSSLIETADGAQSSVTGIIPALRLTKAGEQIFSSIETREEPRRPYALTEGQIGRPRPALHNWSALLLVRERPAMRIIFTEIHDLGSAEARAIYFEWGYPQLMTHDALKRCNVPTHRVGHALIGKGDEGWYVHSFSTDVGHPKKTLRYYREGATVRFPH